MFSTGSPEPELVSEIKPDAELFRSQGLMDEYSNIQLRGWNRHICSLSCEDIKCMSLEEAQHIWEVQHLEPPTKSFSMSVC